MQAAKSLVDLALRPSLEVVIPEAPRSVDPETAQVVNKLFVELQGIYPAYKQAWPDDATANAAKKTWIKAFMAAGINKLEQLRFGLQQCRVDGSDFVPSVGKFIKWCKPTPESLGLPSVDSAYRQACGIAHPAADRTRVHPAVYHAACETGFYELNNLPESKALKLFERAYLLTLEQVLRGEQLRPVPKALPAHVGVSTLETGRAALAAARSALGKRKSGASHE